MQMADAVQYDVGGVTPDWMTALSNLATQGLNLYGQIQLQNMNMDLIKSGRPPLTGEQMASMAPQLNVGIAPDVKATIQQYAIIGGIGVLAIVLLMSGKRSRR
jgi:hypothetical protein